MAPKEGGNGQGNSLEAEILLHFTQATTQAQTFAEKIESISKAFKDVSEAAKTVDNNVGRKLETIVAQLKSADALNINATDLQHKLENALLQSFLQSKINVTGPTGHELKVSMEQKDWDPIEAKLRSAIRKSFEGVVIDGASMQPLVLNNRSMGALQSRLHSQLHRALESHLDFKWDTMDGGDAFKMRLTPEHLGHFMKAIRDKVVGHLARPEMFELDSAISGGKIQIGNKEFNEMIATARTSLNNAMRALQLDTKPLRDIDMSKLDGEKLQEKLNAFVGQLNQVTTAMGSVSAEISQVRLDQILHDLTGFKTKFTREINSIANYAATLHSSLSKGSSEAAAAGTMVMPDYAAMREALAGEMQLFAKNLSSRVTFKSPVKQGAGGVEITLPPEVITQAELAVKNVLVDQAKSMVKALADREGKAMTAHELSALDSTLYAQSKILLDTIVKQANTMVKSFTEGLTGDKFKSFGKGEETKIHRNLQESMSAILGEFSTAMKQLTQTGGVSKDNSFRLAVNDLDKEMRKVIADKMGIKVSELRKLNEGTVDKGHLVGQQGVETLMDGNLQIIFKKFHDKVQTTTKQIVTDYNSAIDKIEVKTDYSPVFYLTSKMESIQKNISDKMRQIMDEQFNALGKALKGIQAAPISFGYDPKEINLNARKYAHNPTPSQVQRPSSFSGSDPLNGRNSEGFGFHFRDPNSKGLVDTRSPATRMPRGFSDPFELLTAWEKQAKINVANVKNRFHSGNLTDQNKGDLHGFLDSDYMGRVSGAINNYHQSPRQSGDWQVLKDAYRDANLALKFMVEQFRKLQFGDSTANSAAGMKNNLAGFRSDARLDVEGIKTKFLDKLNPQQFAELEQHLDSYQAKVERLSRTPLVNEKDIADAKLGMRDLGRELEAISKGFDRIRKESSLAANTNKLSDKMNNLLSGSQLPVNKIQKLGDMIETARKDPTKLGEAKDYYAELVRENRTLQAALRQAESKADREARQTMSRAESAAYRENGARDSGAREVGLLNERLEKMRQIAKLDVAALQQVQDAINAAAKDSSKVVAAKDAMNRALAAQSENIRGEKVQGRLAQAETNRLFYSGNQDVIMDKMRDKFFRRLTDSNYANLDADLNSHKAKVSSVVNTPVQTEEQAKALQNAIRSLNIELAEMARGYNRIVQDQSFDTKLDSLRQSLAKLTAEGRTDTTQLQKLSEMIGNAVKDEHITKARAYVKELENMATAALKAEAAMRKRGDLIGQSTTLQGPEKAVFGEQLATVLRSTEAMKGYEITQLNVNNATNSWSARMRDAQGNLRTMSGTIDKVTGELFKHAEALQLVAANAQKAAPGYSAESPALIAAKARAQNNYATSTAAGSGQRQYFPEYISGDMNNAAKTLSEESKGFMTSVMNTMRYIMAGTLIGGPSMLLSQGYQANKEFEYQMTRASSNFMIKDPEMTNAAEHRMDSMLKSGVITQAQYDDPATHKRLAQEQASGLIQDYKYNATGTVQNMALAYGISTPDAATAYQLASTAFDDPQEARRVAGTASKLKAIEEMPIEQSAGGLSSASVQWGLNSKGVEDMGNMMVMGANLEFTKVADLLEVQKRAGVSFAQNMPDEDKRKAMAYSIAMSSIYTAATGKTGAQGGTFFKNTFGSAFDPVTSKKFEKMAQNNNLTQLNPWVEHTNDKGETVKSQKSGMDMLFSITDVIDKLGADDRNFVQSTYASKWFRNDAMAVTALMSDMDRANKAPSLEAHGGVEGFVAKLMDKDWTSSNADKLLVANMQTYKFQEQKLKTMWEVSTQGIFDNLKDEFQSVSATIMSFLNVIRNNAGLFANGIAVLGKVGLALGAQFAMRKLGGFINTKHEEDRQNTLAGKFDKNRYHLNEEARAVNLRKNIIGDQMAATQNRLDLVNSKRKGLGIDNLHAQLANQRAERDQMKLKRDEIERNGGYGSADHIAINRDINKKDRDISLTQRNALRARSADPKLDHEAQQLDQTLKKLKRSMADVDRQAASINTRMDLVDLAMNDVGLDASKLTNAMNKVTTGFSNGSLNAKKFEQELRTIGQQAGYSEDHIKKLTNDMDKLNKEFEQTKDIDAYIRKLKELDRANRLQNSGINSHRVTQTPSGANGAASGGALYGLDLMDVAMGASLAGAAGLLGGRRGPGGGPPVPPPRTGIWGKIAGGAAAAWGGVKALGKKVPKIPGLGSVGKAGGLLGKSLKMVGKKIPYLGWALTAMDMFGDFITPMGMTSAEKEQKDANSRIGLQKEAQSFIDGGPLNKALTTLDMGWEYITRGTANSLFGGTGPKWSDYNKAIGSMGSAMVSGKNGPELAAELEEKLHGNKDAANAGRDVKVELDTMDKTLDLNNDGFKGDTEKTDWKQVVSYEDAQAMMGETTQLQQLKTSTIQAGHDYNYAKLVMTGAREDSTQMRSLFEDYFSKNIKMLDGIINGTKDENGNLIDEGLLAKRDKLTVGDKAWNMIDTQIKQVQSQQSAMELQGYQKEKDGAFSDIMGRFNHDIKMSGADWTLQKDDAILSGAKEDSSTVKQIQVAMSQDVNSRIGITLGELYGLLDKNKNNETQRNTILEQIRELEVQQKDNLVDIKNNLLKEKSTFNLPDGVQAMSYYEMRMKDGTAKQVSLGSGDVIVHMNVTAGANQDWEKVGNQVAEVVKKANVNVSRELSQQVKTGMQNNHR